MTDRQLPSVGLWLASCPGAESWPLEGPFFATAEDAEEHGRKTCRYSDGSHDAFAVGRVDNVLRGIDVARALRISLDDAESELGEDEPTMLRDEVAPIITISEDDLLRGIGELLERSEAFERTFSVVDVRESPAGRAP